MIHRDPDCKPIIECTYCSTILKSGDKYSLDIAGNIKCIECILNNLEEVE